MPIYAEERNGEVYFCFDPKNELTKVKELYYEWHKPTESLHMFGKIDAVFTIGADVAIVDGCEIKLKEAVSMVDGLPILPMSVYADVIGHNINIKDNVCELVRK